MQVKWFLTLGILYQIGDCQINENVSEIVENIKANDGSNEPSVNSNEGDIKSMEEQGYENRTRISGTIEEIDHSNEHPVFSNKKAIDQDNEQYEAEKKAGAPSDLFATNQHFSYPNTYTDLSRRFVLQYPYKVSNFHINGNEEAEMNLDNNIKDFHNEKLADSRLKPVKAPPELVLAISRQSALREAANSVIPSENQQKDILRSGNYWNNVWREDVDPDILRTQNGNVIKSLRVKFEPGSKIYQLVSALKKISPRLIYVINNNGE